MGFYLQLSCGKPSCGFGARIGNATEFYVDDDGKEHLYGHPVCISQEASRRGIAGYWRDLLCWTCGRRDRESIRLTKPCTHPAMAWSLFPPPSLEGYPHPCPACGDVLCDVGMLQMFLTYRQDPDEARAQVQERLDLLRQPSEDRGYLEGILESYFEELKERNGDPVDRLEDEARDLATIQTEDELILYRLNLIPKLPVSTESLSPLQTKYCTACEAAASLREEMFALMEEAEDPTAPSSKTKSWFGRKFGSKSKEVQPDEGGWIMSPPMKAKRALDGKIQDLLTFSACIWVVTQLLKNEKETLDMFRKRCPKCRAEPLKVRSMQT